MADVSKPEPNGAGENLSSIEKYPYHRRSVRHEVRLKLDVQAAKAYHAWTHNLSADGLCFEIPDQLDNGREITVWLFLDRGSEDPPVQARCRVVWHDNTPKGTRHGGQFLFFAADGLERLKSWLAAR